MTDWHKSTYSYDVGACVEISEGRETRIRDTQHRNLGHLAFTAGEWAALLRALT